MPPVIRALRPKQWIKNVLVFAAPGAAGVLDNASDFGTTVIAFVSFCLAASGIYVWNDLQDVEADRIHPTKRNRPFAAGTVSIGVGRAMGVLANITWDRALGYPIERPKSVTTAMLEDFAGIK